MSRKHLGSYITLAFLLLMLPIGVHLSQQSQDISNRAETTNNVDTINNELVKVSEQINSTQSLQEDTKLLELASKRKELILQELHNNSSSVISSLFSLEDIERLPQTLQDLNLIEKPLDITGTIDVVITDDFDKNKSFTEYYISETNHVTSAKKRYRIISEESILQQYQTGTEVSFSGLLINEYIVLPKSEEYSSQAVTFPVTPKVGDKTILAILVSFTDSNDQPVTKTGLTDMLFNDPESLNSYYEEVSYDKLHYSGDVIDWITIPITAWGYETNNCLFEFADLAKENARNLGYEPNNYDYVIYYTSDNDCFGGGGGAGTLGGFPAQTWLKANNSLPMKTWNLIHEMGHNLGLHHANTRFCGSLAIDRYENCVEDEYGDQFDVMGGNVWIAGHINASQKYKLGWITDDTLLEVTSNGTYSIAPLELNTTDYHVLRIPKLDTEEYYYIEYRQSFGFDTHFNIQGVFIRTRNPLYEYPRTFLYDTTPEVPLSSVTLNDGESFTDPFNGIRFTQISHTSEGAEVAIDFTIPTVTPNLSITPSPTPTINPYAFREAVLFDSDAEYLKTIGEAPLYPEMTFEFWANPSVIQNALNDECPIVLAKAISDRGSWKIVWGENEPQFVFEMPSSGKYKFPSNRTITPNIWTHIALTIDRANEEMKFFVNGIVTNTVNTPIAYYENYESITIGAEYNSLSNLTSCHYKGLIDELRISSTIRYDNNFAPSQYPFSMIPSTLSLWHFDGVAYDSMQVRDAQIIGPISFIPSTINQPAPTPPPQPGDTDDDGDVDISDLSTLLASFGSTGSGLNADFDGDGDVDISDLSTLLANFGS